MKQLASWTGIGTMVAVVLAGCATEVAPPQTDPDGPTEARPSAQPLRPTAQAGAQGEAYRYTEPLYGVVLREEDERLPVFAHPGGDHGLLAWLPPVSGALTGTGREMHVDGTRFVEIRLPDGSGTGWVQGRYLTEWVSPADFCRSAAEEGHLDDTLATLERALGGESALAEITSPRGLFVGDGGDAEPTHLSHEELDAGALEPSIAEALRTLLRDEATDTHCNRIVAGEATGAAFPTGYINFNFLTLAATDAQGASSWVVVFEHVEGRPTLVALQRLG